MRAARHGRRFAWTPSRFATDRRGAVSIFVALIMIGLIGMTALGVEVGLWYETRRAMQVSADTAALGAAAALKAGESVALAQSEAWADARANGFAITSTVGAVGSGPNSLTITVNSPPTKGAYVGNASTAEVIVSQPQPVLLGGLFLTVGPTIQARSVAGMALGPTCVLALSPSGASAAQETGGTISLTKCNMQVNSTSGSALSLTGGSITAVAVDVTGGDSNTGGTITPGATTGVTAVADPYSGLYAANSVSTLTNQACPAANKAVTVVGGTKTLSPGVYCNSLTIVGGTVTFSPGVYIIQGGQLSNVGGTITGSGVTFIMTCGAPPCTGASSNYATASLTGGTANLSAPSTGSWAGMLFYQDPSDSHHTDTDPLTGSNNTFFGALYFPTQAVNYTGGAVISVCTQLVAYTMNFVGSSTIGYSCAGSGVTFIGSKGGGTPQILE
jgi:Flp pilus assembly protein TadG